MKILFSASLDYQSCLANVSNIEYYENLEKEREEQAEKDKRDELLQQAEKYKQEQAELVKNNLANASSSTSGGGSVGQKYNLTDTELENLGQSLSKRTGKCYWSSGGSIFNG